MPTGAQRRRERSGGRDTGEAGTRGHSDDPRCAEPINGAAASDEQFDHTSRCLIAWELVSAARWAEHAESNGVFTCTLIGQGEPIVGTSRIDDEDAIAQALTIANSRSYEERYGTEQWREWGRILGVLREMA